MTGCKQKALLLLMLLTLTGGQWAVLQSMAWAGMLMNRVRTEQLHQALMSTFDGNHPCPLCDAVQKGRKSESKSEVVLKIPRIEFPPSQVQFLPDRLIVRTTLGPIDEFADSLQSAPLLRPPRSISL
jgi:hypothetical protein